MVLPVRNGPGEAALREILVEPLRRSDHAFEEDALVDEMIAEVEANPVVAPPVPDSPDRSGMGIEEEDK